MNETQSTLSPIAWRTWAVSAVAGAGAFMAMLDSTVANLAIESIRVEFGSTISVVQWVVMGLGSALALPIAGTLTDFHGAGNVSFAGAVLLLVSTVPFLVPNMLSDTILVIALAIRGMGLALAQMPAMTAAYTGVFVKEMGDASTIVNIAQRVGGAVGAVSVVIILQQVSGRERADGHIWAVGLLAIISLITLASAASFRQRPKSELANRE